MRVSRIQAAENRQTVINVASRLFRERGFDGIGLKDLMEGAGLTQGAFYKQFASKEDLAVEASKRALESASGRWSDAAAQYPDDPLGAVIAFYLSGDHREERMDGCPIVALGSDAARQGPDVQAEFEAGIRCSSYIRSGRSSNISAVLRPSSPDRTRCTPLTFLATDTRQSIQARVSTSPTSGRPSLTSSRSSISRTSRSSASRSAAHWPSRWRHRFHRA